MTIVHIFWMGPKVVGGIETMLAEELAHATRRHSYHVIFLNDCDPDYARRIPCDVKIHTCNRRLGTGKIGAVWPLLKLNLLLLKIRPDLIVFHALALSKHVFFSHCRRIGRIHNPRLEADEFRGKFDHFVAISNAVRENACRNSRWKKDDISVVYNGVEIDRFLQRACLNHPREGRFRIVQVARLEIGIKAQDLVMRSLKLCKEKYGFKEWTYDMIGAGESEAFLRQYAVELGIDDRVRFLGQVPREYIYENLQNYDLFILPSHYEGLGNVIGEAMAAKIPVLCSNIDGPVELVGQGSRGYLFEAGNEESCATAIMDVYENYGCPFMQEMVARAYVFAKKNMDIKGMVTSLTTIYERTAKLEA